MKRYGALITILLVAAIIFGLFHKIILNANQLSFAGDGDGLKSTFGSVYHIKHDTSYWHTDAMNYPFGESVFFTGNQVVLTNTLKLFKNLGWDLSDYVLGISNILILLSFVIASLFIYLIFKELQVAWWLAIPASVIIILLSTQWERLGGHYNLAYAHVIPVILYLLLRFYRRPSYLLSVIFGILVVLFSARQLYFAAFILVLWIPYWIFLPLNNRKRFGKPLFIVSHVLIQFIIPFLLFSLFTGMHDPGLDRTAYPWGFYLYRVKLEAVFLPGGLPHGEFLKFGGAIRMKAYVGLLGTVVAVIIFISSLKKLIRKESWDALAISDNPAWTILFWAGVISLLIALGLPFSPGWERLLNYTGPFRQLRAVGRFVFPFYYIMTITSFYYLWRWYGASVWRIKNYLLVFILLFAGYESCVYLRKQSVWHRNPISWHSELYNKIPSLEWIDDHDMDDFQAILPLPYFHIGSENYWIGDDSPVQTLAYATSLQSGLPLFAVMLSRTSISQTLLNTDLIREPYHSYPVINELPDRRPFLMLHHKNGRLSGYEERVVTKGNFIVENQEVKVYALEIDSIQSLLSERQQELQAMANLDKPDSTFVVFKDFSSLNKGYFTAELNRETVFFNDMVPDTGRYVVSFWFEGAGRDLWPRSQIIVDLFREDGKHFYRSEADMFRKVVLREDAWGLVEFQLHVREPYSILKLTLKNRYVTRGEMIIDRVLVRPVGTVHMIEEEGNCWINNRQLKTN